MTLAEALAAVDAKISQLVASRTQQVSLRIITGKGRHSPNATGLLIHEVYRHVAVVWKDHLQSIDSPPGEDLLQGLPIKGHFDIKLK